MAKRTLIITLGLLLSFWSCGYHLRGTGSSLPPHIQRISIPTFKNLTTRYQLDVKLTRKVIEEMIARGKVEVTSETNKADAVLNGEILSFQVNPIAFTGQASADRYNITIVARIVLRDVARGKIIFSNPSFIYQQEYEVPEGSDFESVETEAIDKIAEKFARSLVITILEGF